MSQGEARISRSQAHGPFVWSFIQDGEVVDAATGVASASAALDAIKPLVAALPGSIQMIILNVRTTGS